jgi:hypothetical protein
MDERKAQEDKKSPPARPGKEWVAVQAQKSRTELMASKTARAFES